MQRGNELSLGKQSISLGDLFQPPFLVGCDIHVSGEFLVFLSCPPLRSGLRGCSLSCKTPIPAAYPASAGFGGPALPAPSRSPACFRAPWGVCAAWRSGCRSGFAVSVLVFSSMGQECGGFLSTCSCLCQQPLGAEEQGSCSGKATFLFELLQGQSLESSDMQHVSQRLGLLLLACLRSLQPNSLL